MNRTEQRHKTRREQFARLKARYRTSAALADALGEGFSPSYVSQLLSGHRGIGDDVADKIEERLNLNPGYMDEPSQAAAAPIAEEDVRYPAALNGLSLQDWNYLLPSERARLVDQIREMAAHNRAVMQELAKYEKPPVDEQAPIEAGRVVRVSDRREKQVTFGFKPRRETDKKSGEQ